MTALGILKSNWLWGSRKIREGLAGIYLCLLAMF